jgi:peptidoglycan L-alanyl-D-glutamate endopeptidase CwlK
MASYGRVSMERLQHAHPDLRRWCERLILRFDHTVVCTHRGQDDQEEAFENGKSMLHFPDSRHNFYPSLAVDLAPWDKYLRKIDWGARDRFILLAGMGLQLAAEMELPITWGGDWNNDTYMRDHTFLDFPHFQLPAGWGGTMPPTWNV